jgi:predicted nucleic acid-binding protein
MPSSETAGIYYMDTSVILRIVLGHSDAAAGWFDARLRVGDHLVTSRLAVLESVRVLRREGLDTGLGDDLFSRMALLSVDDELLEDAGEIGPHVKSLDAIHLASALRIGIDQATVVTHDANMLHTAAELGFDVHDPVTD